MTVTGFAAAHGAQIYYEVHGRGEPLVLCAGKSIRCFMKELE